MVIACGAVDDWWEIQNYRNILRRYIRDYGDNEIVNQAVHVLEQAKRNVLVAQDKTTLIGYEGMASKCLL